MKAYKILLCVVLCLAMVLSMACASAETLLDAGLTLRNVCINVNGTEVALPHELRLDAVLEDEGAKLRFEIGKDAGVYLPVSGEIGEEGVRFSLGRSGRVYTMDMNTLGEAAGVDMDDISDENKTMVANLVEGYAALIEAVLQPENQEKLLALEDDMMAALTASAGEEVEIEVNGTTVPVTRWEGGVSMNNSLNVVKLISETGIEAVDAYFARVLEMVAQGTGAEVENYDQFMAMIVEESGMTEEDLAMEIMEITCEIGGNDDLHVERVTMKPVDTGMEFTVEEIAAADRVDVAFDFTMDEYGETIGLNAVCTAKLADGALSAFEAGADFEYSYDSSDGEYIYADLVNLALTANGAVQNGLWSADLALDYSSEFTSGVPGEEESTADAASFTGTYGESAEEDGSVTSSIALNLGYGEANYGLSFDFNVADGDGLADLFGAGAREYALTEDDDGLAYELLEIDAASLSADAMEFTADESLLSLMQVIEEASYAMYGDYAYDEDSYDDYEYAYDEDYDYSYDEEYLVPAEEEIAEEGYVTVYSLEDASEVFGGAIPGFTPPEGYELSYVDVDSTSLYADYANAEDSHIGMMLIDFGMSLAEDGSEVTYYEDEDGSIFAAECYSGNNYVMFQFDNITREEAEAIIDGCSL